MAFVHLHVHSQFSILDGTATVEQLAKRAAELGMKALALTDTGNLYGAVAFTKECKKVGVKPIIGAELHVQPEGLEYTDPYKEEGGYQLGVLVADKTGYRNLCQLVTKGIFSGMSFKPRVDLAALREHCEGLWFLTGGTKGVLGRSLQMGDTAAARERFEALVERVGSERMLLELQDLGLPQQDEVNALARQLARQHSLRTIVTNAVHYLDQEDAAVHDLLNAIATGASLSDPTRLQCPTDQAFLKTEEQMRALFPDDQAAIDMTAEIAEQCGFKFEFGVYHFPATTPPDPDLEGVRADTDANWAYFYRAFPPPRDFGLPPPEVAIPPRPEGAGNIGGYFEWYARGGLDLRLRKISPERHAEYRERLERELKMIQQMGFPAYLMIVAEFINWSKDNGIPVGPGRGSAAGSLVAWAMRITDIDPLRYGLLFERFLNPERVSMPDIDVDFCQDRREEAIEHVRQKYGAELVSQIITYGALKAKAAVRDVARVLDLNFQEADRIAKLVPEQLGIKLSEAIDQEPRLKDLREGDPKVRRVLALAQAIEGTYRQTGVHAAGVVIADRPLVEYAPLYRDEPEGGPVVQFDMKSAESVGLIKFDFLGLKTLDQIRDAVRFIEQNHEIALDISDIPEDDEATYALLQEGDALGVFQLESSGMRELLTRLKPSTMDDMVALVALYRPGPLQSGMVDDYVERKHGRVEVSYPLPQLEGLLKSTYGTIIYQEQVMEIAQVLAGYSLGEADLLRRAMGKKDHKEMAQQRARFVSGAIANAISESTAAEIFDTMAKFAAYGFNKCVVAETELSDADTGETLTVGELFRSRRPMAVHALGEDGKLRRRAVTDVVYNGVKAVYELTTELGKRLVATGNHPLRTLNGWTHLEDLAPGDRIAVPRQVAVEAQGRWPEHELVALGWLLSEGNTCHPTALYVYNNDQAAIEDFSRAAVQFPHTKTRLYTRPGGRRMEVCVGLDRDQLVAGPLTEGSLALDVEALRSGAYQWADKLGLLYKRANEKSVPAEVFTLRDEDIALLLGRMWSGDGYLAGKQRGIPPYYASSSSRLARDVQTLLLRLGIVARLSEKRFKYRGGERVGYTVQLLGDDSRARFLERIVPHVVGRAEQIAILRQYHQSATPGSSKDTVPCEIRAWVDEERVRLGLTWVELERRSGISMKEFLGKGSATKRGFRRSTLAALAAFLGSERLAAASTSDVFWDRVVSIEPRGLQDTYDLTVETDHNFLADGIVVHNSHSAAYGYIAYQTAWLKARYRPEFMAALMTIESASTDKVLTYILDCRKAGIQVLPVCVNDSQMHFSVPPARARPPGTDGQPLGIIRFGLAAVRNVGSGAIEAILEARKAAGGRFSTAMDLFERVDQRKVNRRVFESLIKAGALDFTGVPRSSLMEGLEAALTLGARAQQDKAAGQIGLFGGAATPRKAGSGGFRFADKPEWPLSQKLAFEKEVLGLYLSGHPMQAHTADVARHTKGITLSQLREHAGSDEVRVMGMVVDTRVVRTRRLDKMAFVRLEDADTSVECVFFSEAYARSARALEQPEPILVTGKVETSSGREGGEEVKIIASNAEPLSELRARTTREVQFRIDVSELAGDKLDRFFQVLQERRGVCKSRLVVRLEQGLQAELQLPMLPVEPSTSLEESMISLFGRTDVVELS
jgi:DNA polymerase-3 subunit alpha